ncbi:hypothetical protein O6H91_16G091600 [Diphasiastrum complanatum]|uniref:Uncharacterized protein n=1 Tax=Diphasiastrum complanatum TaxID=34168 RepID=A0ACC2BEU2_DIPCM|nr:hypothetical protein O6H91_16G091600 [Diphasiastrum complanatum]
MDHSLSLLNPSTLKGILLSSKFLNIQKSKPIILAINIFLLSYTCEYYIFRMPLMVVSAMHRSIPASKPIPIAIQLILRSNTLNVIKNEKLTEPKLKESVCAELV